MECEQTDNDPREAPGKMYTQRGPEAPASTGTQANMTVEQGEGLVRNIAQMLDHLHTRVNSHENQLRIIEQDRDAVFRVELARKLDSSPREPCDANTVGEQSDLVERLRRSMRS